MATAAIPKTKISGGSFLLEERQTADVFTPEDFSEQQQMIGQTTEEFAINEILPQAEKIEHKDYQISRDLLKKAGDLGLSGVEVPEAYGGLEMDKVTAAVIAEHISKYGGFSTTWGAHTGIGLLPIVYFGTEEQKKKYLPRLATGEMVGAYALSEATSGSDALNCRARAVLSPDGKHYVLNGEKMWITNAGFADLFTVFAKIDGEKFSAFLVERTFPGFSTGAEEHKMGIRGSSTCPVILNDCKVPVENLLGEIGKGHIIAFNILNVGRFKLGAMTVGGAKVSLENAVAYAKQRKAFGKSISDFGLIREKIANMATLIYVGQSVVYRTVGMMDSLLSEIDSSSPDAAKEQRKAIEEYAVECSILKVWGSEMIDYVVDESLQIFAGYGFVEEYPAERAYRDARINRIFEGTNEINRLIITGFLLKRAMSGQLPLMPAIKKLMDEVLSGPSNGDEIEGALAEERKLVAQAKKLGLFVAGSATQKYMQAIQDQQEVMGAIADMTIEIYAMESAVLRTQKMVEQKGEAASSLAIAMTRVYLTQSLEKVEAAAKKVIADVAEGDMLRTQLAIVRRLSKREPFNTIALRQQIAQKTVEAGKYQIA
ncbi:MAG TPA: acyl-CoA dehydrogenase family protein [Terriglobales bacterium]|jgi:alkylation response protein AidB-like acyl-CoA dehydrogenase|nr:acyl-CoA dehydrogenase family protein [Terriglobales bacterium]